MGGINSNVVLLLHGDGSENGTVFTDAAKGYALTRTGSCVTASAVHKFGQAAIFFSYNSNPATLQYLSLAHSTDFNFPSQDFTIDFWYYISAQVSAGHAFITKKAVGQYDGWAIFALTSAYGTTTPAGIRITLAHPTGNSANSWYFSLNTSTIVQPATWNHFAITKAGSILRVFSHGVVVISQIGVSTLHSTSEYVRIGNFNSNVFMNGWMEEIRIVKGVAMWESDFTPPTEPYTMDLPVATVTFGDDGAKVEATWSGEGAAAAVTTTVSASDNPATITLTAEGVSGSTKLHNVGYAAVITMTMYANSCQPIAGSIETTLDQVTFEGDAYKVLEAELSPITFAATARTDIVGRLEEFLENIEASLHGSQEILGSITRDLRPITLSAASIYRHILGSIDGTLHPIILTEQIKGIKGISCTLSVTLPNIELSATAIQNIHASLSQDLPAITAELEIESLVFEIIAMNLLNKAITNFSNYPFNSFCYFDGKYFGCARDGIYQLTGVDDFGANISAHVQFGLLDLEVTLLKRVRHAYLGFKSSGQLTLTITTDDNESYSYTTEHFNGNYGGQKVKFGKGFKDRYIQLKIANTDGCTFALDKTRVFDEPISHRRR